MERNVSKLVLENLESAVCPVSAAKRVLKNLERHPTASLSIVDACLHVISTREPMQRDVEQSRPNRIAHKKNKADNDFEEIIASMKKLTPGDFLAQAIKINAFLQGKHDFLSRALRPAITKMQKEMVEALKDDKKPPASIAKYYR